MSTTSRLPIHPVTVEDGAAFMRAAMRGFGRTVDDAVADELVAVELVDTTRALACYDGEQPIGTALALDWTMAVPHARPVRCAAVTSVTVMPTHRRRGVLRGLMRRQLDDLYDDGAAWAALYSSESAIYGRFGYGVATSSVSGRIDRPWTVFTTPVQPTAVELLAADDAIDRVPGIYRALEARIPGMMAAPDRYWQHRVVWDPPDERNGASERLVAVVEDRAYAMYRLTHDWDEAGPRSRLTVEECLATDTESHRQLWSYLFGVDLIQQVTINRLPVDHPLPWWLAERQRLRLTASMPLYVRLVDVGSALSQRGTRSQTAVTLDVVDDFCPWNGRAYALEGDGRKLRCEPTEGAPELRLDVRELASLSLGGVAPDELARAGLIEEHTPGALPRLGALLASDRRPFNAFVF